MYILSLVNICSGLKYPPIIELITNRWYIVEVSKQLGLGLTYDSVLE